MAVFNTVEITIGTEGRYELSGIFQKGSCGNISETFYKMFEIADSNGFETYSMVSIYFNNPKQVTTDSLLTFMGVFLNDSAETSALSLEGLTRVLPEGDAVYSDLEY